MMLPSFFLILSFVAHVVTGDVSSRVSDPDSPRFGQHLSKSETHSLVQPPSGSFEAVRSWLLEHVGSESQLHHGVAQTSISIQLPVKAVESLLQTKYSIFQDHAGKQLLRTEQYSLPKHLHDHIALVTPTNQFHYSGDRTAVAVSRRRSPRAARSAVVQTGFGHGDLKATCDFNALTPLCVRGLYGTANYTVKDPKNNWVGIANFLGHVNTKSDIEQFLETYRPDVKVETPFFDEVSIAKGPVNATFPNVNLSNIAEPNMDAQNILGHSPAFTPDTYTTQNTDEPFLPLLDHLLSSTHIPKILSISYGDTEQTVSRAYASLICLRFAELGLRGVTVLVASGDLGVGPDDACYSNDGTNSTRFLPNFPSTCPFVTSVGATAGFPEMASDLFSSGAGFSNYFPQPIWQRDAVQAYLNSTNATAQYAGLFNPHGRAYPDLSALGQTYLTLLNSTPYPLGIGTSASTPTAAGVFALVNDALAHAGRPRMGWMNPWLYKEGWKEGVRDVVKGRSAGCGVAGFEAREGWDAVTGWGTPRFEGILRGLGVQEE
ncbi:MAG: hypothetical protein Q9227_006097 [Pyrenula ochraceoflavens]